MTFGFQKKKFVGLKYRLMLLKPKIQHFLAIFYYLRQFWEVTQFRPWKSGYFWTRPHAHLTWENFKKILLKYVLIAYKFDDQIFFWKRLPPTGHIFTPTTERSVKWLKVSIIEWFWRWTLNFFCPRKLPFPISISTITTLYSIWEKVQHHNQKK